VATKSSTRVRPGRVLVVDDDEALARVLVRALSASHEVSYVTSARTAIERLLGGATYDVVLCDVQMPDMDGLAMHAELARRAPDVAQRIIFMTGDREHPRTRAFLDATPNLCLAKPVNLEGLHELIERRIRSPLGTAVQR
jgi:CheY-like chemotaxis protein